MFDCSYSLREWISEVYLECYAITFYADVYIMRNFHEGSRGQQRATKLESLQAAKSQHLGWNPAMLTDWPPLVWWETIESSSHRRSGRLRGKHMGKFSV